MSFLKANHIGGLASRNDWPRYVEDEPEICEREDLDKFFAACDEDERQWFEFFLMTGMREQEVMYTTWPDLNLNRGVVTVRYKREYGFSPKAYKGREIPIPDKLVKALKKWKANSDPGCPILFSTAGGKPKLDFLDACKMIAHSREAEPRRLLAAQVPRNVCHLGAVRRRRFANGTALDGALRYGGHHALPEAKPKSGRARKG